MSKKGRKNRKKSKRNKHYHSNDDSLPFIEVAPNLEEKPVSDLPKVIVDCDMKLSRGIIKRILQRLQFANTHDLRHLSCIRIVDPSTIKLPSKIKTDGCYRPKFKNRKPEIWLSTNLFTSPGVTWSLINLFILNNDRLFETLFHELGHHKAHHIPHVGKYKQEAYAEKYMQAYKNAWKKDHDLTRFAHKLKKRVWSILMNRYVAFVYCFVVRNRNSGTQQIYNLYKQFVFRKLTEDEFSQKMNAMVDRIAGSRKKKGKKKWVHPLRKKKYRHKFRIDE